MSDERNPEAKLLKIGEFARRAEKTVRAVHLYEELELLEPARRSEGGFRLYDERSLLRVRLIDRLQRIGLSLSEIGEVVRGWKASGSAAEAMDSLRGIYQERLTETRRMIDSLREIEQELLNSIAYIGGCERCDCKPPDECIKCERPECEERGELALITGLTRH